MKKNIERSFDPANIVHNAEYQIFNIEQIQQKFQLQFEGKVSTYGRVVAKRFLGYINFLNIVSNGFEVQVQVIKPFLVKGLCLGDYIQVLGTFESTKNMIVADQNIRIVSQSFVSIQKSCYASNQKKQVYRYPVRAAIEDIKRFQNIKNVFEIRQIIRRFFLENNFIEVETPILNENASGSDNLTPFSTFYNSLKQEMFLKVAPECFLKRLLISGMERVFELSTCFRNEGIDKSHKPEFCMLEAYAVMNDLQQITQFVQQFITYVFKMFLNQEPTFEFKPYYTLVDEFTCYYNIISTRILECSIEDAQHVLQQCNSMFNTALEYDFTDNFKIHMFAYFVFSEFVEKRLTGFVFVQDLPNEVSVLAKMKTEHFAFRTELFYNGMELVNMCDEKINPFEQDRMLQNSKFRDEQFINDMYIGLPPVSGFGIGIDRLTMILLNLDNIRDVTAFPQLKSDEQEK